MTISSITEFSSDSFAFQPILHGNNQESGDATPAADVRIVTSGGLSIPVHSTVLATVSTVLGKLLEKSSEKIFPILGVPHDAVVAFLRFLYFSRCNEEEMEKYGMHLLTLSHVYSVSDLKQRCIKALNEQLTLDNVVDVLQLSKLCDAPDLHLKCLKMVSNNFKTIEVTEGWKFLEVQDPWLELEILKFVEETETRQKRMNKIKEEQSLYEHLCEAMACLEHICTEGCTSVGPYEKEPTKNKGPCRKFGTCQGLQHLIRHFAKCEKRVNGRCIRCKRMLQLFKLHSSICNQSNQCKVPLCRQFNFRKEKDARWKILVKKVVLAKIMSSLSLGTKRSTEQETRMANTNSCCY